MTHNAAHVILKLSTPIDSEKPKGILVWHCAAALAFVAFVAGALIF